MPVPASPRESAFRRVQARVLWSSVRYRERSGREGRKRKTQMAKRTLGQPSMRKRTGKSVAGEGNSDQWRSWVFVVKRQSRIADVTNPPRHASILGWLMRATSYAMRPPKAPAKAPHAMKRPMRWREGKRDDSQIMPAAHPIVLNAPLQFRTCGTKR